jgi:hypothetical protein
MYTEILFALVAFYAWRSKTHLVVKNVVMKNFKEFRRLNSLVSTTETENVRIIYVSLKLIAKASYISFIQYMNNSVRPIEGGKSHELTYVINGKMYKLIVTPTRGPAPIMQISNDNGEDVTDIVLPYMGPQYDWHYREFAPRFFGYKSLTFELADGTEKTYEDSESFPVANDFLKSVDKQRKDETKEGSSYRETSQAERAGNEGTQCE